MSAQPRVTAVVVSYNTREDLLRCLASLSAHLTLPMEIIVVDNASSDGSVEAVRREFPGVLLLENAANIGFSGACNRALRDARAPYVLLLNSDAEVRPRAVEILAGLLDARPEVGVVGPRTVSGDGSVQVSFGPPLTPLREWQQRRLVRGVRARRPDALRRAEEMAGREHEPAWVSASCMLARREALDAVQGLDEGFFLYEEDADLCLRLRQAGWKILFTPEAEARHHLGRSMAQIPWRSRLEYHRSHLRYYRKHGRGLETGTLRLCLGGRALLGWLASLGPGEGRRDRRRHHRDVLHLAWTGR